MRTIVWSCFACAVVLTACTESNPERCVPGQAAACACVSGETGAQTCDDEGAFGPCLCEGEDRDVLVLDALTDAASETVDDVAATTTSDDVATVDDATQDDASEDGATADDVTEVETATSDADVDATPVECPLVSIICSEGDEVVPQTTLHCRAAFPEESGYDYAWSLRQPSGSNILLTPSPTARDVELVPNVIGSYTLVLVATDRQTGAPCAPVEYQVGVTTAEAIYVELVWRTPGDLNETDTGSALGGPVGSDLDLHVLHPLAANFFDDVYDTYWFHTNPNWGGAGALDDPMLTREDTDGAGPELFALDQPQFNTTYLVGAHYWDDAGYGSAYATVRVYIYGQLRFTWSEVPLEEDDMWSVCEIEWSSGTVTAIGGATPSIQHDYQVPF